jgi:hypothetical protein
VPEFVVFRQDFQRGRDAWTEVGCARALDAGTAFRTVVLASNVDRSPVGEYRVLPLEGSAHLGVELTLRDLGAPENPADVGAAESKKRPSVREPEDRESQP